MKQIQAIEQWLNNQSFWGGEIRDQKHTVVVNLK
jgi:hypothetical protein